MEIEETMMVIQIQDGCCINLTRIVDIPDFRKPRAHNIIAPSIIPHNFVGP